MKIRALLHLPITGILLLLSTGVSFAFEARLSGDAYTSSSSPGSNFGASSSINVDSSPILRAFIKFDLLDLINAGFTGLNVDRAYLKLYLRTANTAGSFDVLRVTGAWSESTITHNTAPTLGATEASGVGATTANTFIYIDITILVKDWLDGLLAANGVALVNNGTISVSFNSKEATDTSHEPGLEIIFKGR